MSPRRTRKSMPRKACTPEKLLAMPVASTMKSSVIGSYRAGPRFFAWSPIAGGRLLTGAVEYLVVLVEVLGGDHRGRKRRQIGDALALRERREKLGRLGAFLVERLGKDAVGARRLTQCGGL